MNRSLYSRCRLTASLWQVLIDKDDDAFLDIMCRIGLVDSTMIVLNSNSCWKCGCEISDDNPSFRKRDDRECDHTEYPMANFICKACNKKK